MGVTRLLDNETSDVCGQVLRMLLPHMPLAKELGIRRNGKSQPWVDRLQLEVREGEVASEVARDAAEQAAELAESDADGKTRRYEFAVFGQGAAGRQPARLDSIVVSIRGGSDEDESVAKAAARIMSDMGDRHIKVLDQQITLMERLLPMHSQADQMGAATLTAQGTTQVRLTELAIGREERKEMIDLALQLMPLWSGIGKAASDYVAAHAERVRNAARNGASASSSGASSTADAASSSSTPPTPPPKPRPGQVVAEVREAWGLRLAPDGALDVTDGETYTAFAVQTIATLGDHAGDGLIVVGSIFASALGTDWNPLLVRIAGASLRDAATRYELARADGVPVEAQARAVVGLP